MKIFYVPLEPYKERYTVQLSAPITGWLERNWIREGVPYVRVDGTPINDSKSIKAGSVLDAAGRGFWCCAQIQNLILLIENGELTSDDVIYFDDFWTPGISALPYIFHLKNIHPRMYSMLHAQSVDVFDFTYPMRHWMRDFEKGIGKIMSGIFVTSTCLRDLCLYNNVGDDKNLHICGLPYNSEEVYEHFPPFTVERKKNQVIYSSRWDKEKCPEFFMTVMETAINSGIDVHFVITTSATELRSNEPTLVDQLRALILKYPDHIELRENLSKEEYYCSLLQSKVQMNTADQDFVSWTLLEATTCGCRPLYPYFLSFPEVLKDNKFMYNKGDVDDAVRKIQSALQSPQEDYSQVYKPFDESWRRMLHVMKGEAYEPLY